MVTHESMLDKQLEYYKEINNNNNKNQINMVKNQANMGKPFPKLIEVMNMVYAHASNIQVPNPIPENEHDE
jgi:hypothetical protein